MPYIEQHKRKKYDPLIYLMAREVNGVEHNDQILGELNYVLFRLARLLCDEKSGGKNGYARIAVVLSALGEAEAEFRRRVLIPYEKEKERENGDVELCP